MLVLLFAFVSCNNTKQNNVILSQTFDEQGWEKFSPIYSDVEITKPVTYDLSLKVAFTDNYVDNDFRVVFTVFDSFGVPYRAKSYCFKIKDSDGRWKAEKNGQVYEYTLPINNCLSLTDAGKYRFQIDSRMPITPVMGIQKMELVNNVK